MANSYLQKLVDACSGLIADMINLEMPNFAKWIDSVVDKLNAELSNEGPLSFMVPVFGNDSVNLTMTEAPDLSRQNLVKVYFDGLIAQNNKSIADVAGIAMPPRLEHNNSEQIWINERMISTLANGLKDKIFPLAVSTKTVSNQLHSLFPQIAKKYGDAQAFIRIDAQT
jgi:hypothetical protein